jgi:UV DNA damage endonuclease
MTSACPSDVLPVAGEVNVPVVFDAFHHEVNGSLPKLAGETWREADGRQEVHFSTQAPGRRAGAHADTLDLRRFRRFAEQVDDLPLDCVLEVKDKEQSVLRARRTQLRLRQKAARRPKAERAAVGVR